MVALLPIVKSFVTYTPALNDASPVTSIVSPIFKDFATSTVPPISALPVRLSKGPIFVICAFIVVKFASLVVNVATFKSVALNVPLTLKSYNTDCPRTSTPSKPIILSLNSALFCTDKFPLTVIVSIKYDFDIMTASPSINNLFFILASLFTYKRL